MFYVMNVPDNLLYTMNKGKNNPGNINVHKSAEQKHTELKYHLEGYKQK